MVPASQEFEDLAQRLEVRVRRLAQDIGPRHFRRRPALDDALAYLEAELVRLGRTPTRHTFRAAGESFVYLELLIAGNSAREELVVGAHYDTVPSTPGADDNASACAALLEFAEQLTSHEGRRPIRLAWYPNEEPPFFPDAGMGSAAQAARLRSEQIAVHLMISLEMLGYYDARPGTQAYPPGMGWFYPSSADFIAFVGNRASRHRIAEFKKLFQTVSSFPCESLAAPEWTQIVGLSDHSSFWAQGYPALMATDTAFLRNPHYHQPTDSPETLDYPRFAAVTQGLIDAVVALSH